MNAKQISLDIDNLAKKKGFDKDFQLESISGAVDRIEGVWVSTSLSIDHKPDRKDEAF